MLLIFDMFLLALLEDGVLAAIASIGFGSISNLPRRAFLGCAILASVGHMTRYAFMNVLGIHMIGAAFVASLLIGLLSLPISRFWHVPPEAYSFPALLPMIPGMFAYRTVESLIKCVASVDEVEFVHYSYLFNYNAVMCVLVVTVMVIGVATPVIMLGELFVFTRQGS